MKIIFKIKPWTWTCGDGCCSDSGCVVEAYSVVKGKNNSPYFRTERSQYPFPTLASIEAYIITECLYALLGSDATKIPEFRKKIFSAYGVKDDVKAWNFSSGLPDIDAGKAQKIFSCFGFDCEIIEEDCEEK